MHAIEKLRNKSLLFCLLFSLTVNFIFIYNSMNSKNLNELFQLIQKKSTKSKINQCRNSTDPFLTRDYIFHKCIERRRIGGQIKPENKLERTEGAWFVCFDGNLAPIKNDCNILSFGINTDESFDYEMNKDYGCSVHSFDPFIEAVRFTNIRQSKKELQQSLKIDVNNKWKFYSLGITGSKKNIQNPQKKGGIDTLENLIERIYLKYKVIDIFKIDIEGSEINVFENFDIDYACKYIKQIIMETHAPDLNNNLVYNLLKRLEKCFSLFHRDSRLIGPGFGGEVFLENSRRKTGFRMDISLFENEINLSNFLLSTGELYFLNENYV